MDFESADHFLLSSRSAFVTSFFIDGFESGDTSAWSAVNGNPTVQSSVKHKGTYALYSTITSTYKTNSVSKTHTSKTGVYLRFYVYLGALPLGITEFLIARFNFTSSRPMLSVYKDSGGIHWRLRDGGGTIRQYATGPETQTWYCIELKAVVGDESALYVNGEKILTGTAPSGSSSTLYLLAYTFSGTAEGTTIYFDSVEASDSFIGFLNSTVSVDDSSALAEEQFASKTFGITEGISLADLTRVMKGLKLNDNITLQADGPPLLNKVLKVADNVYIVEVVEVGKGDRRTRLFLILGDIAIPLSN